MKMNLAVKFSLPVVLSLVTAFLAGCATPSVDWDSRVGHYTYNEALNDFGLPNRQARLSDGKVQSSWYTQAPVNPRVNSGMSYYGSQGFTANQTSGAGLNSGMLQLIFDTNGVLAGWTKTQ